MSFDEALYVRFIVGSVGKHHPPFKGHIKTKPRQRPCGWSDGG